MDSIGLGSAIANMIYWVIAITAIMGAVVFYNKKMFFGAIVWASFLLNLFAYLFLMGRYRFYPSYFYLIVNKIWPVASFIVLLILIINLIKNKNVKNK